MENKNLIATSYTSYDQVPWFRQRWFMVLCLMFFCPAAIVIAFTGDIYAMEKGAVKVFKPNFKWIVLIASIVIMTTGALRFMRDGM